jgi:ABC-2 type transport system permease protein
VRAVLTILAKDLRLRVRDKSALVVGVLAPFGLAFILNLVTGGLDEDFSASYGVVDHDGGEVAAGFVQVVEGLSREIDVDVETGLDEATARDRVDGGGLDAVFVIPEGFSAAVEDVSAPATELQVIGDVDSPIATEVARSVAQGYAARIDAVRLSVTLAVTNALGETVRDQAGPGSQAPTAEGSGEEAAAGAPGPGQPAPGEPGAGEPGGPATEPVDVAALVEEASQQAAPVQVTPHDTSNRQLDATTYLMAGMAVLFVFFLVQFGVTGLLEEQQEGTMARLLAAPIPRLAVPLAKALTSLVLAVVALATLALGSTVLMGADWGPPAAVAALILAVSLAAVSLVGVVAGVAKTAQQANNAQSIIALVLGMLGGSLFPVSLTGGFVARLSVITPHHWFLEGLGEASAGGLADALPAVGALLLFTVVVGSVGAVLLARKAGA